MYKAVCLGLIYLERLNIEKYQYYEQPQNGDMNVLGPFIPFASPQEPSFIKAIRAATAEPEEALTPKRRALRPAPIYNGSLDFPKGTAISHGFRCVLDVFKEKDVGLVVRLNDEL